MFCSGNCGVGIGALKVCSETIFVVVVDLDPVGVAERFTLVHLMTMNMMANRTTAMTIGTAMAAALLFSEM